ncbi:glycosyltransferase [Dietzia aurantiaca]|uniref:glycosyltransferase n=1 Tax=Dietzia aurantiaca TaxID=983873 RepID=UPI001E36C98D|nr:glycosyltransferase [Dietzia aurantiaca]MCD2261158.1 glycosyltransferase [Dietzia aurantiaca]
MRIALISEHASPVAALGGEDAGGQNVYVAELATGLGARGHDVVVYTRRDDADAAEVVDLAPGVRLVHVTAGPAAPLPKDELAPFMAGFGREMVAHWLSDGVPDIAHAHFWMSGMAVREAVRVVDVPVVQTFHALGTVKRRHQGSADTSPPGRLAVESGLVTDSDLLTASCRDERRELLECGADTDRIHVIPCGVDLDLFHPGAEADGLPPRRQGLRRVVSLGRMVPRKGIDMSIRALAGLPDTELVIAGGPERDALDRDPEGLRLQVLARELGVADRVTFTGRLDRGAAAALLASADVVCITPWYEPFGMVPLETMASGRPLVGTAVGGLLDSVDDGVTGLLVSPGDEAATTEALRVLLDYPARSDAMGCAARRRAETMFSWDRVVGLTEEAYAAARDGNASPAGTGYGAARDWLDGHLGALHRAVDSLARDAPTVDRWATRLVARLLSGGRLLAAGNGGSAAEAQHFTAEFVGRFVDDRRPVSAICLTSETSTLTAISNDYGYEEAIARQVEAHGTEGDVLVLLSTSGTSPNMLEAARRARCLGVRVWALTGARPNPLADLCDETIAVESGDTSVVQECHLVLLHALTAAVDTRLPRPEEDTHGRRTGRHHR